MGLLKSVFNMVKKPLDMAIKQLPIMTRGALPNIISVASMAAPVISEIITGCKNNNASNDARILHEDTRNLSVMANIDDPNINLLAMEATPYLAALTKDYNIMMRELGIDKSELDEYVAIYLLERLNCPPKYAEAIIRTLKLNKKIKESGLLNDAVETSKLHADNIKNIFNIGRDMYSVDFILDSIENDMKPKKIITSEGVDLFNKRHDQLEILLDMTKDVRNNKGIKKIENKIDDIMKDQHQEYANQFMTHYFNTIKENADVNSEEYMFLYGKN